MSQELVPAGQSMVPAIDGLEDVVAEDLGIPRITLDHNGGLFVDQMAGTKYEELDAIVLAQVKQRVLWPQNMDDDENAVPLCKSNDHKTGRPDNVNFPWDATQWEAPEEDAVIELPCAECSLKDWDSHPDGSGKPWCNEQFTFPMLLLTGEEGYYSPAFFTVQRSALQAAKSYVGGFVRDRMPMYSVWTHFTLEHKKRGRNKYVVPQYERSEATPEEDWPNFSAQGKAMRTYLHNARGGASEGEEAPSGQTMTSVAEAAEAAGVAEAVEITTDADGYLVDADGNYVDEAGNILTYDDDGNETTTEPDGVVEAEVVEDEEVVVVEEEPEPEPAPVAQAPKPVAKKAAAKKAAAAPAAKKAAAAPAAKKAVAKKAVAKKAAAAPKGDAVPF